MRSPSKRLLSAALACTLFAVATPASARPDEPEPPAPAPVDTAIGIEDKPPAPEPVARPDTRPTPPAPAPAPPAPKEPPQLRAPTVPYSLGVLGLGAAFIVAGGVMMGVAETANERCGVAGCYGILDPNLDFAGKLFLANGIGIGIASVTATLIGLGTDGTPAPRKSDAFTERGIFATALGAGLACTGLAAAAGDDFQLEGLPSAMSTGAVLGALAVTGLGLGFWIYGARSAPTRPATSLRVGPTSAQFTVHY
ncbi:hypothetical protein [Polyangium sp. 15x6]|uniref:hypothetical protein n=1 Tax=Polyangium sp. 15x6 TaxID=3042687 RepID=UPI00249A142D|nr:hypothetical protein [Polyangium sp. 15x6]MDI3291307.1 hypothetical protein [Polyangium sp. 15x6]